MFYCITPIVFPSHSYSRQIEIQKERILKNYPSSSNKGGGQDMHMETKIIIGYIMLTEAPNKWNRERKDAFHITKD